jgi:hypothetical protein
VGIAPSVVLTALRTAAQFVANRHAAATGRTKEHMRDDGYFGLIYRRIVKRMGDGLLVAFGSFVAWGLSVIILQATCLPADSECGDDPL